MHDRDESSNDFVSRGLSSILKRFTDGELAAASPGRVESSAERRADPEPLPEKIAGYPVEGLIGRGGIGLVYRATDPELGRTCAIKVLARRHAEDADLLRRFRDEARVCSQLQHPGVVPIHRIGTLDDGRPFFVMRIVEGETLAELLQAQLELERSERGLLQIFAKVCQTVAFAHARGVVHGDLKPANVMVGAFGEIQVMDWGFARVVDPDKVPTLEPRDPDSESARHVLGTPAYMAPEQARGDDDGVVARTDVFGLGAMLCEILTGEAPYVGATRDELHLHAAQGWTQGAEERLRACGADQRLIDLTLRCLSKRPEDRPESASVIDGEISAYLESVEARARELQQEVGEARAVALQERRARLMTLAFGASVVLMTLIGAAAWLWIRHDRDVRRSEVRILVDAELDAASRLHERALSQSPDKLEHWQSAIAAAERARALAAAEDGLGGANARARSLLVEMRAQYEDAQGVRATLHWLEEVRPHMTDDRRGTGLDESYVKGFAEHGFDVMDGDVEAIASTIRSSPIRESIVVALDDWMRLRRKRDPDNREVWHRLVRIAERADPDPWRNRLRDAASNDDGPSLVQLAHGAEVASEAAPTISLLAKYLNDVGESDVAIELLRKSLARYPRDVWMMHDLARMLGSKDPKSEEALGLQLAATALRPDSPHMLTDYAHGLITARAFDRAEAVLDRAVSLDPEYQRAWRYLSWVRVSRGRLKRAARAADEAIARGGAFEFEALRLRSQASIATPAIAVAYAERALELQPEDESSRLALWSALESAREWTRLENEHRRELEKQPDDTTLLASLAWIIAYQLRFDEALDVFRSLAEEGVDHGAAVSRIQRWQGFVGSLDAATAGEIRVGPDEWAWYADLRWLQGRAREAMDLYSKAWTENRSGFVGHFHYAMSAAAAVGRTSSDVARNARDRAHEWLTVELSLGRELAKGDERTPDSLVGWVRMVRKILGDYFDEAPSFMTREESTSWQSLGAELVSFERDLLRRKHSSGR